MSKTQKTFLTIYFSLIFLILLRLIPFVNPEARLWGLNHLIFISTGYSIAFFAMAIITLIIPFLRNSEKWAISLAQSFSTIFFESPKRIFYRFIFIAIGAVLFTVFLAPTHFLGDGYTLIRYLSSDIAPILKWTEIGVILFMGIVQSVMVPYGREAALLAFQIMSAVSGIITIWFFFLITAVITEDKIKRLLVFSISVFSGTLLLFFGYVEYYPVIWVFMTGFIYFGVLSLKKNRGLLFAWLFLVVGIFLHLQMAIFIPGAIYLTFRTKKGLSIYRRYKKILWGFGGIFLTGLIVAFLYKYYTDLYIEDMFLTFFTGKPIYSEYAIFSLRHFIDIFNELILISPLLLVFLFAFSKGITKIKNNRTVLFLGLSALGCLLFLFVIDPKLAMPRDWDLFSICAYTTMLMLIILINDSRLLSIRRLIISLVIFAIISTLPFLITNLNRQSSILYVENFINLDSPKTYPSLLSLNNYWDGLGNKRMVDSLLSIYNKDKKYINVKSIDFAFKAIEAGNTGLAIDIIQSIKPNKYDGDYRRLLERKCLLFGENKKALEHISKAIQLRRYNSEYYFDRARVYSLLKQTDKALEDLRAGYKYDKNHISILGALANYYLSTKQYDSSIFYSKKIIVLDSTAPPPFFWLAKSYTMKKDLHKAKLYRGKYSKFVKSDSSLYLYLQDLNNLINNFEHGPDK